jgi:hypothetical protein
MSEKKKEISFKVSFPDKATEKAFQEDLRAWMRQWEKQDVISRRVKALSMGQPGEELLYIDILPFV